MKTWQECLRQGQVIPACPLALEENGKWSRRHQRGLLRYYLAARAGGVAVGVHTTQFDIRLPEHGLYEPLLRETAELLDAEAPPHFIRVAGICGETDQALAEARTAVDLGYHCGLLNPSALRHPSDAERIAHWKAVYTRSGETPLSFRNTSDAETLRNGITAALAGEVTP